MLIGLLLALGCSVCYGTATVLQAAATRSVNSGDSDSGVDPALLLRALRQWRYLVGIALDGLGFVLQVAALRLVPIYVVAAAIAASLAVTAIVAAWVLSTRLSAMEWAAVAVVCASLAMLGVAAGPEGTGHGPPGLGWALLVIAALVLAAGAAAGHLSDRTRALVLGFGAGAGFGVDEIAVRLIDSIDLTQASFYTNPAVYALVAGGAAGFMLLTSALSRGSVTTAVAGMVVGETVGPALVGVAWLGDRTRPGLGWMVEAGFAVAVIAALALSRFGEAPEATES
jgi:drug/metabolite transporter (DMT)-like permease